MYIEKTVSGTRLAPYVITELGILISRLGTRKNEMDPLECV